MGVPGTSLSLRGHSYINKVMNVVRVQLLRRKYDAKDFFLLINYIQYFLTFPWNTQKCIRVNALEKKASELFHIMIIMQINLPLPYFFSEA